MNRFHRLLLFASGLIALIVSGPALYAVQIEVQVGGDGQAVTIIDGVLQGSNGPAAALDPISMAVADVLRGKSAILKVLPKLDAAIVPAIEQAYLSALRVDEEDALLLVSRLGDEDYFAREQATQSLVRVKADLTQALTKARETTRDPEIASRLGDILFLRTIRGQQADDILDTALQTVYERWFDDLLAERAARLLNDPCDEPAQLFFARAASDKIAQAVAQRPGLEQARLLLAQVRVLAGDKPALRALGQIDRVVLIQAARQSLWPQQLAAPGAPAGSTDTLLYERIEGNTILNLLVIPAEGKSIYAISQAFCIFQIPAGPGNARVQTGALLRGRYDINLDTGRIQPFTLRAMLPALPLGMRLPRIPFVEGMTEDWTTDVNRVPLWSKPFVPSEALKPSMKFVLNSKHEMPEADPADAQLTAAAARARLQAGAAAWLERPPEPSPADKLRPADAEVLQNVSAARRAAVVSRLGATAQPLWADAFFEIAQSDRDGAGAAALEALFQADSARAGALALRLAKVCWRVERARYAVEFLKRHFAVLPAERVWDFENRLTIPAGIATRAVQGATGPASR